MTNIKRKLLLSSLCFFYLLSTLVVYKSYAATDLYPSDAKVSPAGPAKKQTVTKMVTTTAPARPGIYWYQIDDGSWRADRNDNTMHYDTPNAGDNCDNPVPADEWVTDKINMLTYNPGTFKDANQNQVPGFIVEKKKILPNESRFLDNGVSYFTDRDFKVLGDIFILMSVKTGVSYQHEFIKPLGTTRPNKCSKYGAMYPIDMELKWQGEVKEIKEIRVKEDSVLKVGESKNYKAEIQTKEFTVETASQWIDVSTRTETKWSSDKKSVATVDSNGKVTAVAAGTATITAEWKSGLYWLSGTALVKVGSGPPPPPPPPPPDCTDPSPNGDMSAAVLDPTVSGVIKADQRGSERFDVLQGIPTSESLYGNVISKNYLYKNKFVKMTGKCTARVPVTQTYNMKWTEQENGPPGKDGKPTKVTVEKTDSQTVTKEYTIERPYSYWVIDNIEVYQIKDAKLSNYALPNGSITLTPNGYTPPYYSASTGGTHYKAPAAVEVNLPPKTVGKDVPNEDFKSHAERAVQRVKVQNDSLQFNGQTIMDSRETEESAPTPGHIPAPTLIGNNVLYSPNNVISNTLGNKKDTPSSGTIDYTLLPNNINGGADKQFQINGINTVTVHTPVVDYAVLPDSNRPFDQRMNPDMSRTVLILDRPFTINFTEKGQHLNIPGYGNRDYKKYTKLKRVIFPFDTYSEDKSKFYPKNTWVEIPVGQPSMTFRMPTWVTEGNYQIVTEAWAVNSAGRSGSQHNYNGNLNNYCATETFDVGVVGRLFGFRIWDIGDLRFENVFRTAKGSVNHTPVAYFSGGRNENGDPTNVFGQNSWILPVRSGSHPNYAANVPHNGYSFLFDFKTIGNVWDKGEGIRIDPTFWYVPRKGGNPIQVDLYYDVSGSKNKMIKVGSANDIKSYTRMYQMPDKMRNISNVELTDAARYEYNHILSPAQRSQLPWDKFWKQFLTRKTTIGAGYEIEVLPYKSRTLIGPKNNIPSTVDATEALRSVQHWYGEYNIPIAPYILPKGTNIVALSNKYGGKLDGHESEFLKKGYIVVNFGIYTLRNNNQDNRILGYKAPIANMWAIEGQVTSSTDYLGNKFNHRYGDIIHFESDFSVRNDFQGNGR
ncbi:DUF5704 domain-containing protein [Paenibacillus alvei]|uniref:DUF5704 domain-containing protein n=1 Tax=Paenibacillus alvei TaxID=44250 RepID=A0ABT4GV93_PAEAL|nr:DUF5704 domain-containing protein [Paenibacillus alvei]MCY9760619.1 DUF5704 domain-containing protein [Paenibacillus alvei]MCY9765233.1 DUF5704 domain-containing protein [Paenibacillus alvei]